MPQTYVTVALATADPRQYEELMRPAPGSGGHAAVCGFIVHLVEAGVEVECTVGAVQVESTGLIALKAPGFNSRTYQVRNWFQSLLSNSTRILLQRGCQAARGGHHGGAAAVRGARRRGVQSPGLLRIDAAAVYEACWRRTSWTMIAMIGLVGCFMCVCA